MSAGKRGYGGNVLTPLPRSAVALPQELIIECLLAHAERDEVRRAYNRAEYLDERQRMTQEWADYPDRLAAGGKVIQLRSDAADSGIAT